MKTGYLRISVIVLILISVSTSLLAKPRAYMGVHLSDLSTKDYEKKGLEEIYGVEISKIVKDGPADKAGFKNNDIILEIAGDKVYTSDQVTKMLSYLEPEQVVKIKIKRDKKIKDINLTLGEKKSYYASGKAYLGVYLSELNEKDFKKKDLGENYGVMISSVVEEGPSAAAGIMDEDILMEIDKQKIYTSDQITKMLKSYDVGDEVTLKIFRDGQFNDIKVTLGEKEWGFEIFGKGLKDFFIEPGNVFVYKYSDEDGKWLGVTVMELTDQMLDTNDLKNGVMISTIIEGTPAEESDLKAGDIILAIDDNEIIKTGDISKILSEKEIDQEITIKIYRDKKIREIKSKVGERKNHKREERVELSVDEGNVRIWIDGEGEILYNLDKATEQLKNLKNIQKEIIISKPDIEGEIIEIEGIEEDVEMQLELLETKKEKEL